MKIALSPALHKRLARRVLATPSLVEQMDVTIILSSDPESFLRRNWRILKPVEVRTVEEASELLRKLEEVESLEQDESPAGHSDPS